MNGVTQREWSFLLLLWGLSDPSIAALREMPQSFSIKLYIETQVSDRLGMSGGRSPGHAQNPLSGERRKTLSITHHALSTPPSHHHLYIIHLINWLQRFYRITMSLKRPFVLKSDIKQWFTTTTIALVYGWPSVGLWLVQRWFMVGPVLGHEWLSVGLWLAQRWFIFGPALGYGWPSVGLWLVQRWIMVGPALVYGWFSVGLWSARRWCMVGPALFYCWPSVGLWLAQCWFMVDSALVYGWFSLGYSWPSVG